MDRQQQLESTCSRCLVRGICPVSDKVWDKYKADICRVETCDTYNTLADGLGTGLQISPDEVRIGPTTGAVRALAQAALAAQKPVAYPGSYAVKALIDANNE